MSDDTPPQSPNSPSRHASTASSSVLVGLNPLGLMDGVLGGRSSDWEPPAAESLESSFLGYTNFSFLDRGGMGAVYAATQSSLSRRVAIKILPPELLDDEGFMDRFKQEASLLARLQHPHIVAVYDFGVTDEGHHYIVMEYVEGVSLQAILRREKISTARALTITAQVCEALHYAHERGVIHRDIKPSNILIDERGLVRVADFGLAKSFQEEDSTSANPPRTKAFMGTLGYAAPELHIRGSSMDRRSDIFSLGVTLYEMLTGRLPAGVFDPPSKLAGTPAYVDKIILRALMQQPEDRYTTAQKMRDAIAASLLRMGTPLVQRTIISKPITSMMTCVIVGMGLIYLIDALNNKLIIEPRMRARAAMQRSSAEDPTLPELLVLNQNWALLTQRWRWEQVQEALKDKPDWQFAEIYDEKELKEVTALLRKQYFVMPVWLAAQSPRDDGSPYAWISGRPMDYQPWIGPASSPHLLVTEIQAKNENSLPIAGTSPDWIEVTNMGTAPIDLTGHHLRHYAVEANRRFMTQEWLEPSKMPAGVSPIIQPGERRIILCSSKDLPESGYASFGIRLEATAGGLHWCDPRGHTIQRFETPWRGFPEDAAIILAADGKSWGWTSHATPGAANSPIEDTFPAPVEGSSDKLGLVLHPGFSGRWTGNPQRFPKPALLRRKSPK